MQVQNEKMQIIGGIFLMFSQGKITKEELDKVTAIENDLGTLESKNKENQYIDIMKCNFVNHVIAHNLLNLDKELVKKVWS